jgi:hypothetical protein
MFFSHQLQQGLDLRERRRIAAIMIDSVAFFAPDVAAETGASSIATFFFFSAPAISRVAIGEIVE